MKIHDITKERIKKALKQAMEARNREHLHECHFVKHYDPKRKGYVRRCSICGKVENIKPQIKTVEIGSNGKIRAIEFRRS